MLFNEITPMTQYLIFSPSKKRHAVLGLLLLVLTNSAQADVKSLLANDTIIQQLKLLDNINANNFSRADATVLLDRLLIKTVPTFNKDMSEYLNPFGDVNSNSDYYSALMHLAYYKGSDNQTVVTKENNLFRPLDYVTRQEFLKMVIRGFNIPVTNSNNLARFNDEQNIASWAVTYFSTAVAQGLIVGDSSNNLNPKQNLSTYEALLILDRVVAKYNNAYLHKVSGFQTMQTVNINKVLANTIGVEREPSSYVSTARAIDISDIAIETPATGSCGTGAKVLRVVNTVDANAKPYYWWTVSNGYLGAYQDATGGTAGASFQKVCFYPATNSVTNYTVTVNGSDNLGFIDSYQKTLAANSMTASSTTHNTSTITLAVAPTLTNITAGKSVTLDLTGSSIKEGALNVALEQIEISFSSATQSLVLFSGNPDGNKVTFLVPIIESLYGQTGTLTIAAHTQTTKQTKVFQNVRYLPKYSIKGEVINSGLGAKAKSVLTVKSN
jgi:hypothetical protein